MPRTVKREFLMLAHRYDPKKYGIGGWFVSPKLDGQRCFWDGGITRGFLKSEVPWANTAKDARYVDAQVATGLWSRYGNVVHAPSWFLDTLPSMPLDGELWAEDYSKRQDIFSIIKDMRPNNAAWKGIQYYVFDTPPPPTIFADGIIKTTNFEHDFQGIMPWIAERGLRWSNYAANGPLPFSTSLFVLYREIDAGSQVVRVMQQEQLPFQTEAAEERVSELLKQEVDRGGEGVMLRRATSYWEPRRSHDLLKFKPFEDSEGVVVGYTSGRETDKGSKLLGLIGALVLRLPNGKELELSGLTDEERGIWSQDAKLWAIAHPGQRIPHVNFQLVSSIFPLGASVTFKYRGLSNDGIPMEARYWRQRKEN